MTTSCLKQVFFFCFYSSGTAISATATVRLHKTIVATVSDTATFAAASATDW